MTLAPRSSTRSRASCGHQGSARYEVAATSATLAAPFIVDDAQPVLLLTTVNAQPLVTLPQLRASTLPARSATSVNHGGCTNARSRSAPACSEAMRWVRAHASATSPSQTGPAGDGTSASLRSRDRLPLRNAPDELPDRAARRGRRSALAALGSRWRRRRPPARRRCASTCNAARLVHDHRRRRRDADRQPARDRQRQRRHGARRHPGNIGQHSRSAGRSSAATSRDLRLVAVPARLVGAGAAAPIAGCAEPGPQHQRVRRGNGGRAIWSGCYPRCFGGVPLRLRPPLRQARAHVRATRTTARSTRTSIPWSPRAHPADPLRMTAATCSTSATSRATATSGPRPLLPRPRHRRRPRHRQLGLRQRRGLRHRRRPPGTYHAAAAPVAAAFAGPICARAGWPCGTRKRRLGYPGRGG